MKKIIFLTFIAFFCTVTFADTINDIFPFQEETDSVIFIDKKTKEKRSEFTYLFKKKLSPGETIFDFLRLGRGNFDKYKDILWETTAKLKEKDGFLNILNSSCAAKEPQGKTIVRYNKEFDYDKKIITWRQLDTDGKIIKEARFPIKGKTADDVTLMYFLKAYVANRNKPGYQNYYLLSNEPKLYKVNIKVIGTETLNLPIGKKKAIKLKLTGDMGIIDDILDKYVPHTYTWYEDAPPYEWLQYEGLETSMKSANIIAYVTERSQK
ncbi:MAG: hypothetical protein HQL27_06310 [Candidatus Omnitrophica bacterium]|nr:hypothetical protein [Candidatus Omnitrophota bacterium]